MKVVDPQPITVIWHSDTIHTKAPPQVSLVIARRVPEFGGDTMCARQHAAVDGLSPAMQCLLDGLPAAHEGTELDDEVGVSRSVVESLHPAVCRHRETGHKRRATPPDAQSAHLLVLRHTRCLT